MEADFAGKLGVHPSKAFLRLGKVEEVEATSRPIRHFILGSMKRWVSLQWDHSLSQLPGHLKQKP